MKIPMASWKPAFFLFMTVVFYCVAVRFVNAAFGPVNRDGVAPENFDRQCWERFGGVNFFAWVVRIAIKDWFDNNKTRILATGNIVTEDWVLTACSPFHQVILEERFDTIRVLPAVTKYTDVLPIREKGIFPYASNAADGCIVGQYLVIEQGYQTVDDQKCRSGIDDYPNSMVHNLLLLQMDSKIKVGDYKLFPRMPFSYNFDSLVAKVDWFNTYRKARCVVARVSSEVYEVPYSIAPQFSNLFEQKGFTYKTMPYRVECVPAVCKKNCSDIAKRADCVKEEMEKEGSCDDLKKCMDNCVRLMQPLLGTLMCLIRLNEHFKGITLIFSVTYDNESLHTPYEETNECVPEGTNHPTGNSPHFMGAPVVCDGEVIAIITKCDEDFIMATSVVSIRHRLLKLFDTSYQDSLVYLSPN